MFSLKQYMGLNIYQKLSLREKINLAFNLIRGSATEQTFELQQAIPHQFLITLSHEVKQRAY